MQTEIFAEWMRRQGYRVVCTENSCWVEAGPHTYQAFPYHRLIEPSEVELIRFLREQKAVALRYSTFFSSSLGIASYHVVSASGPYTLDALPKKARYDVRKGLSDATVEPISLSRLAIEGWELRAETLVRQGRSGVESRKHWDRLCRSAEGLSGFEAWGAFSAGQLVASLLAFTCDDCYSILYQQSKTEHLRNGVNNALTYVVTSEALLRNDVNWIFYGLHSLDAPPTVDQFKFRMNYIAKPVRQRVVIHPRIAPLANQFTHATIKRVLGYIPQNPHLAKAEGMLRFYLEGQRPLADQTWPGCLEEYRSAKVNV